MCLSLEADSVENQLHSYAMICFNNSINSITSRKERLFRPHHEKTCFCIYVITNLQINCAVNIDSAIPLLPKSEISDL